MKYQVRDEVSMSFDASSTVTDYDKVDNSYEYQLDDCITVSEKYMGVIVGGPTLDEACRMNEEFDSQKHIASVKEFGESMGDLGGAIMDLASDHADYHQAIIAESNPWNGEGLPPAGTVCEGYMPDATSTWRWQQVEVLKREDSECAIVNTQSILRWCDQFRPIKTAEEKEQEEFISLLTKDLIELKVYKTPVDVMAEKLYDSGYRKPD